MPHHHHSSHPSGHGHGHSHDDGDGDGNTNTNNTAASSTTRPLLLRILSTTALLLPTLLYILSLSFVLKTLYTPSFALSAVFDANNLPYPSASNPYTYKASPFYVCNDTLGGSQLTDVTKGFNQTCTRVSTLGRASMDACMAGHAEYDQHFCQKVVVSAQLFVAGAVLIGIALLFSFAVVALGWKTASAATQEYAYVSAATSAGAADGDDDEHGEMAEQHHRVTHGGDRIYGDDYENAKYQHHHGITHTGDRIYGNSCDCEDPRHHYGNTHTHTHTGEHTAHDPRSTIVSASPAAASTLGTFTAFLGSLVTLLALLAAILIAAAQMLGINALVENQLPSGIDSTPQQFGLSNITQSSWYMGPGAILWPSVAWIVAVIGVFVGGSGCGVRGR